MNKQFNNRKILLIGCSDFLIDPANIVDCSPDHVLTLQNLAGLIEPYDKIKQDISVYATLEYAVCEMGVKHILIFGHTPCRSLNALLNHSTHTRDAKMPTFLKVGNNLKNALQAFVNCHKVEESDCSKQALLFSFNNLQTYPWVKEKNEAGLLSLHACHLNHDLQKIEQFDNQTKKFIDVADVQKPC